MKSDKYLCDRCGKEARAGGYLLNVKELYGGAKTLVIVPIDGGYDLSAFDAHLCGKECLMLWFNQEVDEVKAPLTTEARRHGVREVAA